MLMRLSELSQLQLSSDADLRLILDCLDLGFVSTSRHLMLTKACLIFLI